MSKRVQVFLRRTSLHYIFIAMVTISGLVPLQAQNRIVPNLDEGMVRLAEILGSLHYLDNLCRGHSDEWRHFMDRLVVTEKPAPQSRARLVSAFNRAYRTFSENYHQCTKAAIEATNLYRQEGKLLADELVNRYGN